MQRNLISIDPIDCLRVFEYGLSEKAEHYNYLYRTVYENAFLWNLFRLNFKVGFHWAIQFIK